jgi:hypothetical protein
MRAFLRLFRAGLDEVWDRSADLLRFIARPIGWLFRRAAWLALWVIEFPILVAQGFWIVVSGTLRWARDRARVAASLLSPVTAVGVVIFAAAVLLAVSQFGDYRGEAIGAYQQPGAAPVGVDPPMTDLMTPIDVHSVALLTVAAAAVLVLAVATVGRRWRLGRAIALLGAVGVGVVLVVDLPRGLEAAREVVPYTDTNSTLLGRFWVELAASTALLLCGLLLSAYMRPGVEARERRRAERERERARLRLRRRHGSTGLAEGRT